MSHDAIVIGAGVNGLVTAHLLARAGRRVLVLERAHEPDRLPDVGWVPPAVTRALDLERQGLVVTRADPWIAAALPEGGNLELFHDVARSADAIRRLSARDAERWPRFCERMHRVAGVLARLYAAPPPDIQTRNPWELLDLAGLGLHVRSLGKQTVVDLLRVLPMSVGELLDEWFESDALKGALAAAGLWHLRQGPRSGGTAFSFLHHHVGSPPGVFRPPISNVGAVLARLPGVEIRRGAEATQVLVRENRAVGVGLASGEELASSLVASSLDPRRTLLGMVDSTWLDPEFVRSVSNVKCRGVVARVELDGVGHASATPLAVAPSLEYLERAYDAAKYGLVSPDPYLETRANNGGLMVHAQYAPYAPADGAWDDLKRRALGTLVLKTLSARVPAARGATVRQVLTPADLEARYGVTEGNLYHGELTLDQILFMRPVAGWSRYRTPIAGLCLCGAGTHPGGGIAGASGRHAARAILADGRR